MGCFASSFMQLAGDLVPGQGSAARRGGEGRDSREEREWRMDVSAQDIGFCTPAGGSWH